MRLLSLVLILVAVLAGCASSPDKDRADMPAPRGAVLEIDPVDMPELPRWFTNREITIEFNPSGGYAVYEGIKRFAKPIEYGRWVRVTYVTVRLEPYAVGRAAAHRRTTLFRDGEHLMMRFEDVPDDKEIKPLRALEGPPQVDEED